MTVWRLLLRSETSGRIAAADVATAGPAGTREDWNSVIQQREKLDQQKTELAQQKEKLAQQRAELAQELDQLETELGQQQEKLAQQKEELAQQETELEAKGEHITKSRRALAQRSFQSKGVLLP